MEGLKPHGRGLRQDFLGEMESHLVKELGKMRYLFLATALLCASVVQASEPEEKAHPLFFDDNGKRVIISIDSGNGERKEVHTVKLDEVPAPFFHVQPLVVDYSQKEHWNVFWKKGEKPAAQPEGALFVAVQQSYPTNVIIVRKGIPHMLVIFNMHYFIIDPATAKVLKTRKGQTSHEYEMKPVPVPPAQGPESLPEA